MGLLSALGRQGFRSLRSGEMFGEGRGLLSRARVYASGEAPIGQRLALSAPDGGARVGEQFYYRGVRDGDALAGDGPMYLHRDPRLASEFAGARFDEDGRPLIETTGVGGNVARVRAPFSNPIEVSPQEMAALGYEPYRIRQLVAQGHDAAISPNGEVLVFDRSIVEPAIGSRPQLPTASPYLASGGL